MIFEDYGSGFGDPGNNTDSVCSTTCTSCVSNGACFHDGSCRCLPIFDHMVCDKGKNVSKVMQIIFQSLQYN